MLFCIAILSIEINEFKEIVEANQPSQQNTSSAILTFPLFRIHWMGNKFDWLPEADIQ